MQLDPRLQDLALKRAVSTPPGFHNLGEFHNGAYECEFVSPYSKSAHSTQSGVLIFLQDWISADVLAGELLPEAIQSGRIPSLPTNRNLDRLLQDGLGLKLAQTYATNLFPFIKPGGMSAPIPMALLRKCATEFAIPHIQILHPRLVVALGLATYNALASALGGVAQKHLSAAIECPFEFESSTIWCQAHPGALGQNSRNRERPGQTTIDWEQMGIWYSRNAP